MKKLSVFLGVFAIAGCAPLPERQVTVVDLSQQIYQAEEPVRPPLSQSPSRSRLESAATVHPVDMGRVTTIQPPVLATPASPPAAQSLLRVLSRKKTGAPWIWPTDGQLALRFNESTKGLSIQGAAGQPVVAAANGMVVYVGDGIRGYGQLVIIKHANDYLSAYGHNSRILVKEGDNIAQGEKIAEMGDSGSDTVKLHFELRLHGKPIDPVPLLPPPA